MFTARWTGIVAALVSLLSVGTAHADPAAFALVDGRGIVYKYTDEDCEEAPCVPRSNLEALADILPSPAMYENSRTVPFEVKKREPGGAFPGAKSIVAASPDVVLVHWSSFAEVDGGPCYPKGEPDDPAVVCAQAVVNLLRDIYAQTSANIVIYSRKTGICEDDFNKSLRGMVYDAISGQPKLNNFPNDIGFVAMTQSTDWRNFDTSASQGRLRQLIDALIDNRVPRWSFDKSQGLCILSSLQLSGR